MTPNWPELWEREPGLRPDNLTCRADIYGRPLYEHEHITELDGRGERCPADMPEKILAALCRDAAVRWLSQFAVHVVAPNDGSPPRVFVHWLWGEPPPLLYSSFDGEPYAHIIGVTLDDALFAACSVVLDNKLEPAKKI